MTLFSSALINDSVVRAIFAKGTSTSAADLLLLLNFRSSFSLISSPERGDSFLGSFFLFLRAMACRVDLFGVWRLRTGGRHLQVSARIKARTIKARAQQ